MWCLTVSEKADFEITTDSLNVVNIAQGYYHSHANPDLGAMVYIASQALGAQAAVQWRHINSHIGHPWNELADDVAGIASSGSITGINDGVRQLTEYRTQRAWEWLRREGP